jgi:hypothetical protein
MIISFNLYMILLLLVVLLIAGIERRNIILFSLYVLSIVVGHSGHVFLFLILAILFIVALFKAMADMYNSELFNDDWDFSTDDPDDDFNKKKGHG